MKRRLWRAVLRGRRRGDEGGRERCVLFRVRVHRERENAGSDPTGERAGD